MNQYIRNKNNYKSIQCTTIQSGGRNNKSSIHNLRKFHNWIKSELLGHAVKNTKNRKIKLLDLSVGRGGDLHKWNNLRIHKVIGIDIHEESIREAERRYGNYIKYNRGSKYRTKLDLQVFDLRDPGSNQWIQKKYGDIRFDTVSCQFALHYFFESMEIFDNLIKMISHRLRVGGFFVGTTLDGEMIKRLLQTDDLKQGLSLNKYYDDDSKSIYGQKYGMVIGQINDSGTSYFDFKGESIEYLVDIKEMIKVCRSHGLGLVEYKPFEKLYNQYPGHTLSPEEKQISFLYFSFMFKKY